MLLIDLLRQKKLHRRVLPIIVSGAYRKTHLELVLLAAKVGSLLLPKVVRLDDVRRVDCVPKMVLQHLEF